MRETRQSGSEGGGACGAPYPYPDGATSARFPSMQQALRSQNGLHPIALPRRPETVFAPPGSGYSRGIDDTQPARNAPVPA